MSGSGAEAESRLGTWSRKQDKEFENAIAKYLENGSEEDWKKIASEIFPSKTIDEVKLHYQILLEDVKAIEDGLVPIPNYINNGQKEASIASSSTSINDQ